MGLESETIRTCVVSWLKQAGTLAGARVEGNRKTPIRPDAEGGPVLSVFMLDEDVEIQTDTPREYRVTAELAIEGFVEERPSSSIGSADARAAQLEDEVFCCVDPRLPSLEGTPIEGREPLEINPSTTALRRREVGFDYKGRAIAGAWRLTFDVVYARVAPVDDLGDVRPHRTAALDWDLEPSEPEIDAQDEIAIAQA